MFIDEHLARVLAGYAADCGQTQRMFAEILEELRAIRGLVEQLQSSPQPKPSSSTSSTADLCLPVECKEEFDELNKQLCSSQAVADALVIF